MVSITYLPEDARERLLTYEYHAEDRSYIYKYLLRPLCRWLVERLPVWLAPNTITVTALAIVCATHALLAYYMPKLTIKNTDFLLRNETGASTAPIPFAKEFLPPPPVYVFVLAALGLMAYQLLDNLDGHQARRTSTSSPLGLLMDHGCDAFNCVIGSLSVASAVSAGPCWKAWLIVLNTLIVFFMNTWEEYYRGVMVLPVVNGPNEGILIAILIYLWTAWQGGPHWWVNHTLTLPQAWLPAVLRQPAPDAAVAVEKRVLEALCPWLARLSGDDAASSSGSLSPLPFFLHVNCSSAYMASPPRPIEVLFDSHPQTAAREQILVGRLWHGHSVMQKAVLQMYGTGPEGSLQLQYNSIAVLTMTLLAWVTCAGNVYQVWRAIRNMTQEERRAHGTGGPGWFSRNLPFLDACRRLLPLLVLTVMANAWFFTSQESIFRSHPRIFSWTVGLLYTKTVIHLMVSHLCGCEFHSFRRTFVPFVLFGGHMVLTYLHNISKRHRQMVVPVEPASTPAATAITENRGADTVSASSTIAAMLLATSAAYSNYAYDLDEELILYEFFALTVVTFTHLVWNLSRQMAGVLEVPIFTVSLAKQEALKQRLRKEKEARETGKAAQTRKKQ